jgi:adenosylcobinamide amidohydrolase
VTGNSVAKDAGRRGVPGGKGVEALITAEVHDRVEDGRLLPLLVWRFADPLTVASTASCGGGLGERRWIVNAQVARDYRRRDLHAHGAELAARAGVSGAGVVMLTAADVRRVERAADAGVTVAATVGLTHPTWAAGADDPAAAQLPGTINIVAFVPARLGTAALLNALCTATEAKTQALVEAGVPGTGTASDAVTVACPPDGPAEPFAGPRSVWGARLARAVHQAVQRAVPQAVHEAVPAGAAWPDPNGDPA